MTRLERSWKAHRVLLAFVLCTACAPSPRPAVFADVERTRTSAAATSAHTLAPQAYLAAERLREDAIAAYRGGDRAGAELLAEQALAAYAHADAIARMARAEERIESAAKKLTAEQRDFAAIDEQQRRVAAEADDIETRVRVARDAVPLSPTEPSSVDREHARLVAARALAVEARLLCMATQMLSPSQAGPAEAFKSLDALDAELDRAPAHPPIDTAVRLRSSCLTALTEARRPSSTAAPELGTADALLDELGKAGLEPGRDDRGIAVVLRNVFEHGAVQPKARERLAALGQVARAHPAFPVLVVLHGARGRASPADSEHAKAVAQALTESGAAHVESRAVGDALPVAPPGRDAPRNERVEVVFVAPAR